MFFLYWLGFLPLVSFIGNSKPPVGVKASKVVCFYLSTDDLSTVYPACRPVSWDWLKPSQLLKGRVVQLSATHLWELWHKESIVQWQLCVAGNSAGI